MINVTQQKISIHKRHICSFDNKEKGGVVIEAAIVTPLLLFIVFNFILYTLFIYQNMSLQFSLDETLRTVTIGKVSRNGVRINPVPHTPDEITQIAVDNAARFGINIENSDVQVCNETNLACTTNQPVLSDKIILLSIERPYTWFGLTLKGIALGRAESF